jgi:hypothetical protein
MDENDPTPPNLAIALIKALFGVIFFVIAVASSLVGAFWGVVCLMIDDPHGGSNGFALICAVLAALAASAISALIVRRILKAMSF